MTGTVELASDRFAHGFNCAQSILAAFAADHGMSTEAALRLAAPFGGGLGRAGEVCGALSGALMVLGLRYATDRPEDKDAIYRITREFMAEFQQQHGAVLCRELVGFDIATPEGLQAARAHKVFAEVCPLLVASTAKALERYLNEHAAA